VRSLLKLEGQRLTGALAVHAEGVTTVLHFAAGRLVFAEGGTLDETLGRMLVDDGVLSSDGYARAIEVMNERLAAEEQMRLGDVLVALGLVSEADLARALVTQIRRKVMRCLQWDELELELQPGAARLEDVAREGIDLGPVLIEGVARFVDRFRRREILRPHLGRHARLRTDAADMERRLGLDASSFLRSIDGMATLGRLVGGADLDAGDEASALAVVLILTDALELSAAPRPISSAPPPDPKPARPVVLPRAKLRTQPGANDDEAFFTVARAGETSERHVTTPEPLEGPAPEPPPAAPAKGGVRLAQVTLVRQPIDERRKRLAAEQAYQRGIKALWSERWAEAETELRRAAAAMPDALEYKLAAAWASYRQCADPAAQGSMRERLGELSRELAKQNNQHALPPYVLGHLALSEGDVEHALQCFRVAVRRDASNTDAAVQVLALGRS
jgi:hypothetical protein